MDRVIELLKTMSRIVITVFEIIDLCWKAILLAFVISFKDRF